MAKPQASDARVQGKKDHSGRMWPTTVHLSVLQQSCTGITSVSKTCLQDASKNQVIRIPVSLNNKLCHALIDTYTSHNFVRVNLVDVSQIKPTNQTVQFETHPHTLVKP
ncbi:hypothetical protein PR048_012030 [Dryococelus australis]|uniref:Uncharacterized protein n=1 Tax=Dryococelus australis TaxID=614101 RepID=A0ABQ9HN65_9NEOP|nr:hypothetical protein PR048_012030 [Dryococelus australis]